MWPLAIKSLLSRDLSQGLLGTEGLLDLLQLPMPLIVMGRTTHLLPKAPNLHLTGTRNAVSVVTVP